MTEQEYRVIADRDKGDDPYPHEMHVGDWGIFEVTDQYGGSWNGELVRIERPVPPTDEPPTPDDATYAEFERQEQELFRHQPVMSREDGGIIGCQCRDTFFRPGVEDWGTHLALVMRSLQTTPHPPTREQIADLALSIAVRGGREGIHVTDEDRDGADYLDCLSAADAVLALIQNGADR